MIILTQIQIEVTFEIHEFQILYVTAKDKESGNETNVTISTNYCLSYNIKEGENSLIPYFINDDKVGTSPSEEEKQEEKDEL